MIVLSLFDGMSATQQAYKMLGNSFTVEMIKCILKPIH